MAENVFCPDIEILLSAQLPCPFDAVPEDNTKYKVLATYQIMPCPYGEIWNQEYCTCDFGECLQIIKSLIILLHGFCKIPYKIDQR